jgi:hypothetical protein
MVKIHVKYALAAVITSSILQTSFAVLPVINLFPDCVSSQVTTVCGTGGNVVQSLSANPLVSPLGFEGWAFVAQTESPTVNWRFYSFVGQDNSPIISAACSTKNGLTFVELGSTNAADGGTIWIIVYLAQASNILQPLIRISAANGCTYDYPALTSIKGGPVYLYTNVDDGSHPEIMIRIKLNAPIKSATCTNSVADGALVVSSLSIRNNAVSSALPLPANFVALSAGFMSGPSVVRINCVGSFNFVIFPALSIANQSKLYGQLLPQGPNQGQNVIGIDPIFANPDAFYSGGNVLGAGKVMKLKGDKGGKRSLAVVAEDSTEDSAEDPQDWPYEQQQQQQTPLFITHHQL